MRAAIAGSSISYGGPGFGLGKLKYLLRLWLIVRASLT
jgi:hypothetical protein